MKKIIASLLLATFFYGPVAYGSDLTALMQGTSGKTPTSTTLLVHALKKQLFNLLRHIERT